MDDPDAPRGTWTHWLLYNLPASRRGVSERMPRAAVLPAGVHQGRNDFGVIGYEGPCPPHGPAHRYHLTLIALDTMLALPAGATRSELDRAMRGHVLETVEITGRYQRGAA